MTSTSNTPESARTTDNFVLLAALQNGNGAIEQYRVGRVVRIHDEVDLAPLVKERGRYIAGGLVPIQSDHENLHIYGTSHNDDQTFDFKIAIERVSGGQAYAEICIIDSLDPEKVIQKIDGFVVGQPNIPNGENGLTSLSSTHDNHLSIQARDGIYDVNLGKVDMLVVDCGIVERSGPAFRTQQIEGDSLSFYIDGKLSSGHEFGTGSEYDHIPVATISSSRLANRFNHETVATTPEPSLTSGNIKAPLGRVR